MDGKRRKKNFVGKSQTSLTSSVITAEVETLAPISTIQQIIGKRLRTKELTNHDIYLQDIQLEPTLSLYDQGVKVDGKVELSIQVETQGNVGKLTIVEIAKNMTNDEMQLLLSEQASLAKENGEENQKTPELDKEDLGIPCDPATWTPDQVVRWMIWVSKEFGLDTSVIKNLNIDGKRLSSMTIEEFILKIPYGNILWSHLSLLKKISANSSEGVKPSANGEDVALNLVVNNNPDQPKIPQSVTLLANNHKQHPTKVMNSPKKVTPTAVVEKMLPGNRSGNNGQIQLWQFLLDLLTDANERDVIAWQGDEGEFKLIKPEIVAQKWGERKNKPAMNYEKLSRALRYYYDGNMISKVQGKRFVYKFDCNLREILGYGAADLNRQVSECERKRQEIKVPVHLMLVNGKDGVPENLAIKSISSG